MLQSLSVLVENRAGVLTRVTNLFARRGFNIESLAVGATQNAAISRISITVDGDLKLVDQITKQLHKLPDVLIVRHLTPEDHFSRELIFIKIRCTAQTRSEIMDICEIFRGHVIDVSPKTLTIEMTGNESKIVAIQELLEPYGVLELVRTGTISIERGEQMMNVELQNENNR